MATSAKWHWISFVKAMNNRLILSRGTVERIAADDRGVPLIEVESFKLTQGWTILVDAEHLLVRENPTNVQIFIREDLIDV